MKPATYQDPQWFHPKWAYAAHKEDLRRCWDYRNNGGWARGSCRLSLQTLRVLWPKGTVHPDKR